METIKKNLIKTNTKIYRKRIYKYLLDCINFESEGVDLVLTDKQKIEYFFSEFGCVANHPFNISRYPNLQNRLSDYLQGLPSSFNIAFYNYDILEIAKKLHGTNSLTEREENIILKNYWNHMAYMLICLKNFLNK